MSSLKPYNEYIPVQFDYFDKIPNGWKLLPNLAIFQERKEKGGEDLDLLSNSLKYPLDQEELQFQQSFLRNLIGT